MEVVTPATMEVEAQVEKRSVKVLVNSRAVVAKVAQSGVSHEPQYAQSVKREVA